MLAAAQRAEAKRALLEARARARKDAARAKDVVAGEKEEFLEKLREARVASALEEEIRTHEVDGPRAQLSSSGRG